MSVSRETMPFLMKGFSRATARERFCMALRRAVCAKNAAQRSACGLQGRHAELFGKK
ncbi:hypothetical protein WCP94_001544 [Bilophila wadsworthia]